MWHLATNPYTGVKGIIDIMAFLGALAMLGIILAIFMHKNSKIGSRNSSEVSSMGYMNFFIWLILGIFLSYLNSPQETFFEKAYTHSKSIFEELNINIASSWTISYSIFIFLFSDCYLDQSRRKGIKTFILSISLIYVTVYLQLLKGDREVLTLIVAIFLLFLFIKEKNEFRNRNRYKILLYIFISLLILFPLAYLVALFRTGNTYTLNEIDFTGALGGTWSAVLLSPLSVAGDHYYGLLKMKNGSTYIDLFLSIVPGFLADLIGYVRPIDGFNGPAWEMRYGQGGTHAIVVPFMNFGYVGVFFIVFLITKFLLSIENYSKKVFTQNSLSLYGIILMIIPHWLWYGEKYFMNALIIWAILSIGFSLSKFFFKILNIRSNLSI